MGTRYLRCLFILLIAVASAGFLESIVAQEGEPQVENPPEPADKNPGDAESGDSESDDSPFRDDNEDVDGAPAVEAETPPEVADAIDRLSSPEFAERQRAFEELAEMGPEKTVPALERAARTGDRETRARAIELIRRYEKVRTEAIKRQARAALDRLGIAEEKSEEADPLAAAPPRPLIPPRLPAPPRIQVPPRIAPPMRPPGVPFAPNMPMRPRIEIRIAPPGIAPPGVRPPGMGPRIVPIPRGGAVPPIVPPGLGRPANPPGVRSSRLKIHEVNGVRKIELVQDDVTIEATVKEDGSIEGQHSRPVDGEQKTDPFQAERLGDLKEKFPEVAERLEDILDPFGE